MFRVALIGLALTVVIAGSDRAPRAESPQLVQLQVGQIWRFEGRAGEPDPTLVIVALETDGTLGRLVHVSIWGISMSPAKPNLPPGVLDRIGHMPFQEESLRNSLRQLVGRTSQLPEFEGGYRTWKRAYDAGEAGVFTISVAQAIDVVELSLKQ